MADATRPKATRMTVCDLCDKEIPDGHPSETGSLTHGWLAHPVEMGERPTGWRRTLHAWLLWPPAERVRTTRLEKRMADPEQFRQRKYDFHAECILQLVEDAMRVRTSPVEEREESTVCIAHGRFIPCRKDGEHRYTSNPYWVKSVRDYQGSPIDDLTWQPAWENGGAA